MLIDTHAHLWWESYQGDLEAVITRAQAAGVEKIIVPGTNVASSRQSLTLAKEYPGIIYPAVGIHPEDVVSSQIIELEQLIKENRELIVAVGEIGIDLYTQEVQQTLSQQKALFKAQLELANEFDLPVVIHTRNSFVETWEVLQSLPQMPRGQFHCFSVDEEALKQVIKAGFYVSFCANLTWSKRVAKLVPLVPSDRLLLETDSPFMAPQKRNEPAQIKELAMHIATLRGEATEQIAATTTSNAKALYTI